MPQAEAQHSKPAKVKKKGKVVPAICNVLGTLLLIAVIAIALPLAAPDALGFKLYNIMSGSMEPELPVGSLIVVQACDPETVLEDDIVAYENEDGVVIAHRVVTNREMLGELVTKGDANESEDPAPIPYSSVLGKVTAHVDALGDMLTVLTEPVGKVYLLLVAACGVMLNVLAGRMRARAKS